MPIYNTIVYKNTIVTLNLVKLVEPNMLKGTFTKNRIVYIVEYVYELSKPGKFQDQVLS